MKTHFGAGSNFDVDSSKPFTVVTQFITADGTDSGELSEIKRFYIQDGKKIANAKTSVAGLDAFDSITDGNCDAQKQAFGEKNDFKSHGGMKAMSDSMERGMVLVMSIWDDAAANMLWLDSVYPAGATGAGAERGPCSPDSGSPADGRSPIPMPLFSSPTSNSARSARQAAHRLLRLLRLLPRLLPRLRLLQRAAAHGTASIVETQPNIALETSNNARSVTANGALIACHHSQLHQDLPQFPALLHQHRAHRTVQVAPGVHASTYARLMFLQSVSSPARGGARAFSSESGQASPDVASLPFFRLALKRLNQESFGQFPFSCEPASCLGTCF